MIHLSFLEKQEQTKSRSSRWKEIMEIRQKLMQWGLKKQYKELMKQKLHSLKR
jgi:hypothetical protein